MVRNTTLALVLVSCASSLNAGPVTFGVFGSSAAEGVVHAQNQGHTASVLADLMAPSLTSIDVLWVLNGSNSNQPGALVGNADVADFVMNGGILLYHDRRVTGAGSSLPGSGGFSFTRETANDTAQIDVLDGSTLVTNGPGGVIDNTTLDGGGLSSHGYVDGTTLPGTATTIFSRTDPNDVVDFRYDVGLGQVYYSTIPLDHYLAGNGVPNFDNVYAPNVVAYVADLAMPADAGSVPEPGSLALFGVGAALLGASTRRRRRQESATQTA